ncbi:MAG: methyltransferase family protein, partial [Anaerolineales bacterium]
MRDPLLARSLGLFLPLTAVWLLWLRRTPDRRQGGSVLLACAWCLAALPLLHLAAMRFAWWRFEAEGGLFFGIPVDLYLGWSLLWGAVPALALPRSPVPIRIGLLLAFDLVFMPALAPVLQLGPGWLIGEAIGLVAVAAPAQAAARWTYSNTHLRLRALLQVATFAGLSLGLLPAAILTLTGANVPDVLGALAPRAVAIVQVLALPALIGVTAVQEFVERGGGTPIPFDPPRRLVTSGVYAYLANPMQFSASVLFLAWGALLGSMWVVAAAGMAIVYSIGLARWGEAGEMQTRFGPAWIAYRSHVRAWIPRWRPWHAPQD